MTKIYEIGPFQLDAGAVALTGAGASMAPGSRTVAVLTTLVKRVKGAHDLKLTARTTSGPDT